MVGDYNLPNLETAGADGSDSRQMVADEENLSEGTSQNPVLQSSDERDSEQSLGGGSAESQRTGGNSREADGTESRADGADESGRYDEVGSPDEQHQELGTGNREESGNIRLEYYDRNHEDKSLPFFGGDDTIREILGTTRICPLQRKKSKTSMREIRTMRPVPNISRVSSITTTPGLP